MTSATPITASDAERAALELLEVLEKQDVRLAAEAGKLRVNAPKGALTDPLKAAIGAHREALLKVLSTRATSAPAPVSEADSRSIRRIPRGGPLPVSSAQKRFWFLDQMAPGRPEYNIGVAARVLGPVNDAFLRRAFDDLVARHETLRMRLVGTPTGPASEVLPPSPADLKVFDLTALEPEAGKSELHRLFRDCLRDGFDLRAGTVSRCILVRTSAQECVLVLAMHHAAGDGWSLGLALSEMFRTYESLAAGRQPVLAELAVQYPDYAGWEREQLRSGRMARQLSYWKQHLAGAPAVLELPFDRPRPAVQSFRGQHLYRRFDTELLRNLKEISRKESVTLFMTLLAALQVLLHRYSGQDDIAIGSPVANRNLRGLEELIGCLVNNVVLRGRLDGNPTFSEYLSRVKPMTLDAFENGDVPFDALVEAVNPPRTTSHSPLFQVMFSFLTFANRVAAPAGLKLEMLDDEVAAVGKDTARFDLTVDMMELEGELYVGYEFSSDLFDVTTIERLHSHLGTLLRAVARNPACRIGELPLMTREEETLVLDKWNDTALEYDHTVCVHQLLEATARAHPMLPAVTDERETLTYGELDSKANRLAHLLRSQGVAPGVLVGICLDRTADMPVALAAVLKAGGAYVPLDPTHPADRLDYILGDAGVACVITLARFADRLTGAKVPLLALDELESKLAAQPATAPRGGSGPEDLAYVIYTSGSTGRPKGVQVEHRNVTSFLEAMRREPGLQSDDVLLAVTTLSFDIAGLEMWLPLAVGARIVIASRADLLDGQRLIELIEKHQASVLQATPATWRLLVDAGWTGSPRLKALCGGEALQRDLAISVSERVGELWNVYGPTETTIWSTTNRLLDPQGSIPIGHPIANTRVYVLEPSGQVAPIGVPGELCIAGDGVARGYRNRPELTAEKFNSIALPGGRRERVYRTGDLVRLREEGQLEFIGRRDTQVKVRGYRIELGEIETVLATHAGVKECVAVVREDTPGDQRLVAYVVPEAGVSFDADAARATLREKLPEYMLPNQFVTLEALPLTPNGKIDRKGLPAPRIAAAAGEGSEADDLLMTPVQRRVATIWRDVLGVPRVGLNDNFFDLGGHSLILVKLQASLNREFARDVPLVELFQHTTVAAQADRMNKNSAVSDAVARAQARAVRQLHG